MPIYEVCKLFRLKLKVNQRTVASDLGCSRSNVAAFENGRNNSSVILNWYLVHGLTDDPLFKMWQWANNDDPMYNWTWNGHDLNEGIKHGTI